MNIIIKIIIKMQLQTFLLPVAVYW